MRGLNIFCCLIFCCFAWYCRPVSRETIETDFAISRPEQINSIEIFHRGVKDQILEKSDGSWILNQKYKIRSDAMDNILRILPDLKVLYYPPKTAWENMERAIREEGVKLVFKDGSGRLIKSFSLGGTTNDERGTYAILEGAAKPYVIHVPGFEGSLANRFNMTEAEWRDRMIFHEKKEELQKLIIRYPAQPSMGFELEKQGELWVLFNSSHIKVNTSPALIQSYLDDYDRVGAESIENEYRYIPQVLASAPHAVIEWHSRDGSVRTIKFYPVMNEGQTGVDRFYVYDGRDFFLAQMRILQKIFRSIDSF